MNAKFVSIQYLQQYGRKEAVKILEKMAELNEQQAFALKGFAQTYHNAANILKLTDEPEKL